MDRLDEAGQLGRFVTISLHDRDFGRKAHHYIGRRPVIADEMEIVGNIILRKLDMRGKLLVDAGGQGSRRLAEPPGVQFEHDGHEEAAFAKLHPFEMADMVFRISSGSQLPPP